jgi:hypothetical protein
MVTSSGLASTAPGSADDSGKSPTDAGLSLNLNATSVFSPPEGRFAETAPGGDPASDGLVKGPRSIFTFSPGFSRGPEEPEPIGGKTEDNPGIEMVSRGASGSEGLMEKRGLSLTEGGVAWATGAG